ncbi:hypothetical protein [Sphingomonas trueperi]|uniref:hypothetical protein n=1 Tax=Sphingomonas trueperi TaxID=53317 RepID=UPI0011C3ED00
MDNHHSTVIDSIFFDVIDYTYTDDVRNVVVLANDNVIHIYSDYVRNFNGLDFWITPSEAVRELFGEYHQSVYGRFFGLLLTAMHKHASPTPIRNICLGDVARAYEGLKSRDGELADQIASGTYFLSRGSS